MKLKETLNPKIYYSFGDKEDSLTVIKLRQSSITINDKDISFDRLVMAEQTHSREIKSIDDQDLGSGFMNNKASIPIYDGFITDKSNVFIVIKGADCTPILVYAKSKNVVGACHSGREGTKKGIIKELIRQMNTQYLVELSDIVVMIGPAISGVNYQVSEDIYNDFVLATKLKQDYRNIDMQKVIIRDVLEMGVKHSNIIKNNICTFSNEDYFSYRRNKSKERQLSVIGIVDEKLY